MKRIINILLGLLMAIPCFGQEVEMADSLRSDGKIYVVVTILLIILLGLTGYLVFIDRKVTRLEKKLGDRKPS